MSEHRDPTDWTESAAIRQWARDAGYDVPNRGRIPQHLITAWVQAGSPYPDIPTPWSRRASTYNARSKRTSKTPVRPPKEGTPLPPPQVEQVVPQPEPEVTFPVTLVSGATAQVLSEEEVTWFEESKARYLEQHRFTENTDLQDLDRLLQMELLSHRWGQWLLRGKDYRGRSIDDMELAKKIREQSAALTSLKEAMGLTKKARDATAAGVADRWASLMERAKAFGVHRENQLREALMLMNDLSAKVGTFDRGDEDERQKIGLPNEAAIMEWIRSEMLPRYHKVDAHFRENEQRYWRRD